MLHDSLQLLGTVIGEKYRIDELVAEGGFSIVYRATHLLWKRPVAIKVFSALKQLPEEQQERLFEGFLREGALLAELSERSAAICQARDTGTLTTLLGKKLPYLVLEWLDGLAFDQVLERERTAGLPPRSLQEALHLLEPAMKALALAHASGISHRDIKPANLFVLGEPRSEECRIKVLDFGIAQVAGEAQRLGGIAGGKHVSTPFTPAFAAPEQFSRSFGPTGPWTDVYGMALVLVETLTGRDAVPAEDPAMAATLASDANRRPTPRSLGVELGDAVEAVFQKALAVRSADRYAAADELLDALRAAIDLPPVSKLIDSLRADAIVPSAGRGPSPAATSLSGTVPTVPPEPERGGARRGKRFGVLAAGVAGAIAIGLLARTFVLRAGADRAPVAVATATPPAPPPPLPEPQCPEGTAKIPGGHFFMGSDDGLPMEKPAHGVFLAPFCMDIYEVTTGDYKACSDRGDCKRAGTVNEWDKITAKDRASFDPLCNVRDPVGKAKHPINCVDWSMANTYCRATKKRLPTEAEWEFAARGPDGRRYPWGDDPPTLALLNACGKECVSWGTAHGVEETAMYEGDDGFATTAPVGSFPKGASPYGIQDVVGNVWEWAADWYKPYTAAEQKNPQGPDAGESRVIRGGSWNGAYESWVRPTFRYHDDPAKKSYGIGFRCAQSLEVSSSE